MSQSCNTRGQYKQQVINFTDFDRYVVGDLQQAFNTLLKAAGQTSEKCVIAVNPYVDVTYSVTEAESVCIFNLCALAEIGNTKSNLIAVSESKITLFPLWITFSKLRWNVTFLLDNDFQFSICFKICLVKIYSHCLFRIFFTFLICYRCCLLNNKQPLPAAFKPNSNRLLHVYATPHTHTHK